VRSSTQTVGGGEEQKAWRWMRRSGGSAKAKVGVRSVWARPRRTGGRGAQTTSGACTSQSGPRLSTSIFCRSAAGSVCTTSSWQCARAGHPRRSGGHRPPSGGQHPAGMDDALRWRHRGIYGRPPRSHCLCGGRPLRHPLSRGQRNSRDTSLAARVRPDHQKAHRLPIGWACSLIKIARTPLLCRRHPIDI
jgi:hypothetical protein